MKFLPESELLKIRKHLFSETHKKELVYDFLKGESFYADRMADALRDAQEHAGPYGAIASLPELIAARLKADKEHELWKNWYDCMSEENIGIDKEGKQVKPGEAVLVVVHGGGILSTPERIEKAIEEKLVDGSAKYTEDEWHNLLDGRLPNGKKITLYPLEEILHGTTPTSRNYGIVMPYEMAQATKSGYHTKEEFIQNPLVLARIGNKENAEQYFDFALQRYFEATKDRWDLVGNWYPFKGRDPSQPQGNLLFLSHALSISLLYGFSHLISGDCFLGVVPDAQRESNKK